MKTEFCPSFNTDHDCRYTFADRMLINMLHEMRFGSVEITVHNGNIVQLEKREKVRFDSQGQK